jgi:uncharacterized protein YbjQ (UPF0145 family)
MSEVIISTAGDVRGWKVKEFKGVVFGTTVRTRWALGRFMASFEGLLGGKAESYLSELEKAKNEALEDAVKKAQALGANAIIGVDFDMSEVLEGYITFSVNGTAVVLEKEK